MKFQRALCILIVSGCVATALGFRQWNQDHILHANDIEEQDDELEDVLREERSDIFPSFPGYNELDYGFQPNYRGREEYPMEDYPETTKKTPWHKKALRFMKNFFKKKLKHKLRNLRDDGEKEESDEPYYVLQSS